MDPLNLPPSHVREALDAAVWPLADAADAARLRGLTADFGAETDDTGRGVVADVLAVWLVLARVCGLGADVYAAFFYLGYQRLGAEPPALLKYVEICLEMECASLKAGAPSASGEPAPPVLRLVCPSQDFLALLYPAAAEGPSA